MSDSIWTRLTIKVPQALEDPLSDFLSTLTGRGVRIYELNGDSAIEAYLSPETVEDHMLKIGNLLENLVQMNTLAQNISLDTEDVPEEDWMEVFRSQHKTVHVSDRLKIRPTWCEPEEDGEVVLDPGMAFGTGSHPTTKMCLILLDSITGTPPPARMLDLGTGSGILALASARLGVKDILSVDIDPVAVLVAMENVYANKAEGSIKVIEGSLEKAEGLYDVITANIFAALLEKLAPQIVLHLVPGGHLIVSGILEDEWDDVLNSFTTRGLELIKVVKDKVWVAALLVSPVGIE